MCVSKRASVDGDDVFKELVDPAVMSARIWNALRTSRLRRNGVGHWPGSP